MSGGPCQQREQPVWRPSAGSLLVCVKNGSENRDWGSLRGQEAAGAGSSCAAL